MNWNVFAVAIGASIGGVLRYGISLLAKNALLPWSLGTLSVNVIGGLMMGFLAAYFSSAEQSSATWGLFWLTGVCGGFTTFSAFSLELMQLLQQGKMGMAVLCLLSNVLGALFATILGYFLYKTLAHGA